MKYHRIRSIRMIDYWVGGYDTYPFHVKVGDVGISGGTIIPPPPSTDQEIPLGPGFFMYITH